MKNYIPARGFDVGVQIAHMRKLFPGMQYSKSSGGISWTGELQPSEYSDIYTVKIIQHAKSAPKAFVLHPALKDDRPHKYEDGSLCLYYPVEERWRSYWLIAKKFVPWICEYLYFYECWLETGVWFGEEAAHKGAKIAE